MKICSKCSLEKDKTSFYSYPRMKDGLYAFCKDCSRLKNKEYRKSEKWKEYKRKYQKTDESKEKMKQYRKSTKYQEYRKKYRKLEKSKEYDREYSRNRKEVDPQFKLGHLLRSRLYSAIRNGQKMGSAIRDLGCTVTELKLYIESQFRDGMNWDNWTYNGWHIDHKIALANFDLTDREQFLQAVHYTNLQPLWAMENFSKGNR